jgi:hypothetical protein
METLPEGYGKGKKEIIEKYEKKVNKALRNFFIGILAVMTLTVSSAYIKHNKLTNLKTNYPVYQEHINNQNSLGYLENRLKQYELKRLPEFLSKDIKSELENISVPDSARISSLEKAIKIAEQDNARITNTTEFKEYSEREEKIERLKIFSHLGLGFMLAIIVGGLFQGTFYSNHRDKELKALDKKYGVFPEE